MMNFRQRMGWIGVVTYLLLSLAALYYMFEINQTYNRLALDHVEKSSGTPSPAPADYAPADYEPADYAPADYALVDSAPPSSWMQSVKSRLLLLPLWLWASIFLILYLQVFFYLYSCTRTDPKTVGYCILPICLTMLCNRHASFTKASNQISRFQLIDT
ncbi:transmembrane protein 251 [Silurus asotus]|uniref:Lysosomal enzyme trafficking factor n=1 Tax=Silurus asotus TaxID=30991 RepID=A0AAD5AEH1_SILAS|nr:transmembrane protein 251 [Silurus asotus]